MKLLALPAMLLTATIAGCGLTGPAHDAAPVPGTDAVVELTTTLNFAPEALTIPAGATVEFRNGSILAHSVEADPAHSEHPGDIALPPGAQPFRADVPAGGVYRHTFTVPGTYRYYCDPHHGLGMKGTITVTG